MPKPCKFVSKQDKFIFVSICHYCGVEGHIRPNCFKLKNSQNIPHQRNFSQNIKFNTVLWNNFSIENIIHKLSPRNKFLHDVVCFSSGKFFNMNANMIPKFVKTNLLGPSMGTKRSILYIFVFRFIWKSPMKISGI